MVKLPKNPSSWQIILFVLSLPFQAVVLVFRAVFLPPEAEGTRYKRPTGYGWEDKNGVVHKRYYVYDDPPF